jgi:hypothetical protein
VRCPGQAAHELTPLEREIVIADGMTNADEILGGFWRNVDGPVYAQHPTCLAALGYQSVVIPL